MPVVRAPLTNRGAVGSVRYCLGQMWRVAPLAMVMAGIGAAVSSQFMVAGAYVQGLLVDRAVYVSSAGAEPSVLILPLVLRLAVEVVGVAYGWITSLSTTSMRTRVTNGIRLRLLEHVSRLDISSLESPEVLDALVLAERGVGAVPEVAYLTLSLARMSITTITSLCIVAAFDWRSAVIAAMISVPCATIHMRIGRMRLAHERAVAGEGRLLGYATGVLRSPDSNREMRVLGFRRYLLDKVRDAQECLRSQEVSVLTRSLRQDALAQTAVALASAAGTGLVLLALSEGRITVGQLVFFIGLVVSNIRRAEGTTNTITAVMENAARIANLRRVLDMQPSIAWPARGLVLQSSPSPCVEFRQVSYRYPRANAPAVSNVSFSIGPGQRVALVGENGAGKTTLIRLLLRFYDPDEGTILIDGRDIREYDLEKLWERVTYLPQDFGKYNFTARENLALGDLGLLGEDAALLSVADRAGLRQRIQTLPLGLETHLGTLFGSPHQLSGGEWQRLALARALAREASLVILDEPTSSIDPIQESLILRSALHHARGRSTLIVSHRLLTVRDADTVVVMQAGQIAERGSHTDLLARGGMYTQLYNEQAGWYSEGKA